MMTYVHYSKPEFITKLSGAVALVIEAIPTSGVLVFIPSYALLHKCVKQWSPNASKCGWGADNYIDNNGAMIWERLENSKGKVIVKPTGSQAKFKEAHDKYANTIHETGCCILLAVFLRKMSEGISFNDANVRAVICVGIPFPLKSMLVKAGLPMRCSVHGVSLRGTASGKYPCEGGLILLCNRSLEMMCVSSALNNNGDWLCKPNRVITVYLNSFTHILLTSPYILDSLLPLSNGKVASDSFGYNEYRWLLGGHVPCRTRGV